MTAKDIASVCGLPTPDCIRKLVPEVKEEALQHAVEILGQHEKESILNMGGQLYPGVLGGLEELGKVYPLFLVSNCNEWYLNVFFDLHRISHFFSDWECYGRTGKSKGENLRTIALRNRVKRPIYIGDTESDYSASQLADYDFGFVSYGFGKVENVKTYQNFLKLVEALI